MKLKSHNIILTFFLYALLAYASSIVSKKIDHDNQPAWDDTLNFEEIEHRLQTEAIISKKNMRSFLKHEGKTARMTHPISLVTLESGLKAVLKKETACYGEVAAYKAAKALGLRIVPPTVLREIKGKKVSLQFYVASSIDLIRAGRGIFKKLRSKDVTDKDAFYYLFNQWDPHIGNQIITHHDGKYYLALIDNAGITFTSHKPDLVSKKIYASTYLAIKKLTKEKLEEIWSDYLPVRKVRAATVIARTLERKKRLLKLIEQKGSIINNKATQ